VYKCHPSASGATDGISFLALLDIDQKNELKQLIPAVKLLIQE
jgi:hypothetical protein